MPSSVDRRIRALAITCKVMVFRYKTRWPSLTDNRLRLHLVNLVKLDYSSRTMSTTRCSIYGQMGIKLKNIWQQVKKTKNIGTRHLRTSQAMRTLWVTSKLLSATVSSTLALSVTKTKLIVRVTTSIWCLAPNLASIDKSLSTWPPSRTKSPPARPGNLSTNWIRFSKPSRTSYLVIRKRQDPKLPRVMSTTTNSIMMLSWPKYSSQSQLWVSVTTIPLAESTAKRTSKTIEKGPSWAW